GRNLRPRPSPRHIVDRVARSVRRGARQTGAHELLPVGALEPLRRRVGVARLHLLLLCRLGHCRGRLARAGETGLHERLTVLALPFPLQALLVRLGVAGLHLLLLRLLLGGRGPSGGRSDRHCDERGDEYHDEVSHGILLLAGVSLPCVSSGTSPRGRQKGAIGHGPTCPAPKSRPEKISSPKQNKLT